MREQSSSPFSVPCKVCGSSTLRVEFRDQFPRNGEEFIPEANGMWIVCINGHESPGPSDSIFPELESEATDA